MNVRDYFAYEYKDNIDWSYSCIDRIVINGMFNMAQTPGGFRYWWRDLFGDDSTLTNDKLRTLAGDFSRRVTYESKGVVGSLYTNLQGAISPMIVRTR